MNNEIAGKFMAFKGNDEYGGKNVLVEVTDFTKFGDIELAFDAPIPENPRIYLRVSLPDIIQSAMNHHLTEE